MIYLFISIETTVFFVLAILHFYWSAGGRWGVDKALPVNENGIKVIQPKPFGTFMVGMALFAAGVFYMLQWNGSESPLPAWLIRTGNLFIFIIFGLRSVGEFKYVGLFKKIRDTEFARFDTFLYVPLTFFLALLSLTIELYP